MLKIKLTDVATIRMQRNIIKTRSKLAANVLVLSDNVWILSGIKKALNTEIQSFILEKFGYVILETVLIQPIR